MFVPDTKIRCPGFRGRTPPDPYLKRTSAMTVEILYLTTQIQRWLNERIARHLAAQAAKLDH